MGLTRASCVGLILLLAGCSAFSGPKKPYARVGAAFPAAHNLQPKVGGGVMWDTGARAELTYRPTLRIEEPSTRGDPEWMGGFYADVIVPLGR